MRNKIIIPNLILLLFLTSCNPVPPVEIENIGIIDTRGTDLMEDNQIRATLLTNRFNDLGEPQYATIEGTGRTIGGALENADYKSDVALTGGQTEVELFGMEAAKRGIESYIQAMVRDARAATTPFIAVGDPSAKEVMMAEKYKFPLHVGRHLQILLQKEIDEDMLPNSKAHYFSYFMTEPGMDPVAPIIGNESGFPAITGMAVFQNDTYAGEVSHNEAFFLHLFRKRVSNTPLEITVPLEPLSSGLKKHADVDNNEKGLSLQLTILRGRTNNKLIDSETLHYQSNISLDINILEMSQLLRIEGNENQDMPQRLAHEIEKEIERQYDVLLEKLKEMNADPLGLGQIYRSERPSGKLDDQEWRENFSDVTVDFNADVNIVEFGTLQ